VKAASNAAPGRLLIIFDQFEELLILQDRNPERLKEMRELLNSLYADPIKGLTFVLSFRSDYLPLLENFELPDLTIRKNWFEVGAFTESAAREFLKGSNIMFSDAAMKDLFEQIAAFEGTKGLVRPIILNMVGMIVQKSGERESDARQKKTENLMAEYLQYNLYRRDMKDHAPEILEHMVTDLGTTIPRSVPDLMIRTGIPRNEIKGTFNLLANAGLVRQIDQTEDMWEVAHDFIAQYLLMVIRGTRKTFGEIISPWLAPVSLCLWTAIILFFAPPYVSKLSDSGFLSKIFNPDAHAQPKSPVDEPEIPPEFKLPVELQINLSPAEGFEIISTEIIPQEVTVEGDDSLLSGIEKIQTDYLDFTGINEDVAYYVELISPSEEIILKPGIVNIKIDVEPIPIELPQKNIPAVPLELTKKDKAFDYSLNSKTVIILIEAPEDQIEDFDGSSLKIIIDASSYKEGSHNIAIENPELPEGFNTLEITPPEIELIVKKKTESQKPDEQPKDNEAKKPDDTKTDTVPAENSSAKDLFETAMSKYEKNLYDDAIGIFKKAIEKDPNYRNALYYCGLTYYNKAESGSYGKQKNDELYSDAITNFTKVIQLNSNDKQAYYYRGLSLMELGKNLQAPIDDLLKYVQLSPSDKLGHFYLGTAYNKKYEWNSAIASFKEALNRDINYKSAYGGLWTAYKLSKDLDGAITTYSNMIKKNPSGAVGYYYLGLVYDEKGDHAKAVENIKKALEIYPAYTDATQWLQKAGEI
ncbi:tetratricopeptide repeat protein, partial [bacterium]|nr:tetratricopeptide repeat protein [bacterium]MBU1024543.1 tetratricopeptide repeat protein [bacterium]